MNKTEKGFTLVELMIVLAIIGILVGIALPSYENYMRKARRADAQDSLTAMAAALERYYSNNQYTYTDDESLVGSPTGVSAEGYYALSITIPASADSYTITATAQGVQIGDTECRTMTLDSTGIKASADAGGAATMDCW